MIEPHNPRLRCRLCSYEQQEHPNGECPVAKGGTFWAVDEDATEPATKSIFGVKNPPRYTPVLDARDITSGLDAEKRCLYVQCNKCKQWGWMDLRDFHSHTVRWWLEPKPLLCDDCIGPATGDNRDG